MKKNREDTSIAFVGAGNLATHLAKALYLKGFRIVQVYSRTEESAQSLAQKVGAEYTTELSAVTKQAQLYIVSLKDTALVQLLPEIVAGSPKDALWVHTAGSIPMNIWEGQVERYGVFYPMQTFSKLTCLNILSARTPTRATLCSTRPAWSSRRRTATAARRTSPPTPTRRPAR